MAFQKVNAQAVTKYIGSIIAEIARAKFAASFIGHLSISLHPSTGCAILGAERWTYQLI